MSRALRLWDCLYLLSAVLEMADFDKEERDAEGADDGDDNGPAVVS